jgi:hypothetical protein
MRIAADQFVNGAAPTGALEQSMCVEIATMDGAAWAYVALEAGEALPTEADLIAEQGASPVRVAVRSNGSGVWKTVSLEPGAEISARPGYPRLILVPATA